MNCFECSIFDIHFENFSRFTEKKLLRLSPSFKIYEKVFHADALKERNFFDHYSVNLFKALFSSFFTDINSEQKQLILCLVIHDKILTTNAGNPSITL
jgi:hypothetical protein